MRVILIPVVLLVLFSACLLPAHTHAETIRCESRNGELKECGSNISAARLIQQITDWPCDHGRTWGVRNGHVWVSNFCRGIFEIQRIQERYRLTVGHAGQGFGSIQTNPSGIDYPTNAEALFPGGSAVLIQATPETGSVFSGWSGDCSGRGDCLVSMVENRSVTAHFNRTILLPWLGLLAENDRVNPTISITSPTSSPTYTSDSSSLNIAGTASDNVGVTLVTWANGRDDSGTCIGTAPDWSASAIPLYDGTNVLTVTAWDAVGNTSSDTLTVTYYDPTSPILLNPNYSLVGLNDTPDPEGGLNYSTFNLSFEFYDINGDANAAAGATLTVQYQFTDGGNSFEVDHTDALDGVNGSGDTVQFEENIRFDNRNGLVVTFILTDGADNSGNPLQMTIDRPEDAN